MACPLPGGATLVAYQPLRKKAPAILIVPAPVKTFYIWDLKPASSPVRRCRDAGFAVYLLDWARATNQSAGLDHYADLTILKCLEAIQAEMKQERVFLAGHSLGGTFAAIFASLHPRNVRGLVEIEAPLAFEKGTLARAASLMHDIPKEDSIPGFMLDVLSSCADPCSYVVEPWLDWVAANSSPLSADLHLRVRRWTLDERPMPGTLFCEVLTSLYRDNCFVEGRLKVGGLRADARAIEAPVLAIANPRSRVVPLESIEAYRTCTRSRDVQIREYAGDAGVVMQHIGGLVGPSAHDTLWPGILAWIKNN